MDLAYVLSPVLIALGATLLLLIDLAIDKNDKRSTGLAALGFLLIALISVPLQPAQGSGFRGLVEASVASNFIDVVLILVTVGIVLMSLRYNEQTRLSKGEYYALLLFSLSGMMLVGHSANLLTLFMAIELLSIPLYVLCGIAAARGDGEESALKYFLLGAFASGFLVMGIALVYGATGQLDLAGIANATTAAGRTAPTTSTLLAAGAAMLVVALGFKVAAVPFHMWTPDVYDGAPTTVTAFMATATKAAGFMAFIKVFFGALIGSMGVWAPLIAILAALTMIVGNVLALAQNNVKRMLAYSSIAHAGYLLAGIASGPSASTPILFYLAAYAITSIAAFAVLAALHDDDDEDHALTSYEGLSKRKPVSAWIMAIALFSLMGMPLTAGFAGKYMLFQNAINNNLTWLAIIGVLTSVISAFYYLRVIVAMFMSPGNETVTRTRIPNGGLATMLVAGALTLLFGVLPTLLLNVLPAMAAR